MLNPEIIVKQYPYRAYVYICYLHDKPVYVGKGTNNRYLHCISGKSTNVELNRAFFEYGADAMRVQIIYFNLQDDVALSLEQDLIQSLLSQGFNLFNISIRNSSYSKSVTGEVDIPEWVTEEIP